MRRNKSKDIDYALTEVEENNKRWIEVKGKMNDKMFIIAEQLKDVKNCQRKIIETQIKSLGSSK